MRQRLTKISFVLFVALSSQNALSSTAAVSMPEPHAAAVAKNILLDGGNAIDAAIASAFVLAVTYPEAGNIGGGGFMLSYMNTEAAFLDFRERAPLAASRDMYLDESGNVIPDASLLGGQASGVPGTVKGMAEAHKRYGSVPWEKLLQPAIELAKNGFLAPPILVQYAQGKIEEVPDSYNFKKYFGSMRGGEMFTQPELAATLALIAQDANAFYTGLIATQIASQMQKIGGLITRKDLAQYQAKWRTPLQSQWRDYTVLTAPPPSSGGFALIQLLGMRDYAREHFRDIGHNSPTYIHLLAEIEKRVFADRAIYLGDSDYVDVPMQQLLAQEYLAKRAAAINPTAISPAVEVPAGLESTDTTHFSILDHQGNAVSLTYTLNWEFGSGVVVDEAGFVLNNQMDDFSAKPGVKNKFGVVGNTRNSIAPGKRMLSSMTPTIVLKENKPALIIGTPGGSTIFTSVFQVILNLYDYAMPLQQAVNATRFHHQLPDAYVLRHDQRPIAAHTARELKKMGYTVEPNSWGDLGDIAAIAVQDKRVFAASDSRGRGVSLLIPEQ